MPDRRRFLQAAAFLSAAPSLTGATAAARAGAHPVDLVLYDERFAPSRAFGQAALALGARVRRIDGDITPLWRGELNALWRERPAPIAGVTLRSALFCLEQLAWDRGLRVRYRAMHDAETDSAWPAAAAQTLMAGAPGGVAPDMLTMAAGHDDEFTLYSWIIAPTSSRARMGSA